MANCTTLVGESKFLNKNFRTMLIERDGYAPQIRIETWGTPPDSSEPSRQSSLKLRLGCASEIAHAILSAAEVYYASTAPQVNS